VSKKNVKHGQRSFVKKLRAKQIGLAPGSLVYVGEQKMDRAVLTFYDYDPERLTVCRDIGIEECTGLRETKSVSWINLDGIHDVALVEKLGQAFDLHPLALEDILNTQHRPKLEEFEGYTLIIVKMLSFDPEQDRIDTEQVSLVMGPQFVLSFQERSGDVFDALRERLNRSNGKIRLRGTDYLVYAILDSIVDSYYHVMERLGDRLAELEVQLTEDPDQQALNQIHHFKRELVSLRKAVWPLREVISVLQREDTQLVDASTSLFLRDLYDHTIQVIDTVEIFFDTVAGLLDLYLSSISNKMNEVMKVLTIIATIFIPLTFIAGVYGMNFENMPELHWRYGYVMVWGVMLVSLLGMVWFLRRKKWF